MKKNICMIMVLSFSLCLAISNGVFCKGFKGLQKRKSMVAYDKETYTSVKGIVKSVDTVFNRFKQEKGLHLTVKTSSDEYIVHVCPQWYADKKKLKFNIGELVSVSGSEFTKNGEKNIYAARLTHKSFGTLKLREPKTGNGLWFGRYQEEMQSGKPGLMREKYQKIMQEKRRQMMKEKWGK